MRCNKIQLLVVAADAADAAAHATPAVCLICRVFLLGIFWVFLFCFFLYLYLFLCKTTKAAGSSVWVVGLHLLLDKCASSVGSNNKSFACVYGVCLCVGSEIRSDICMCSGLNGFILTQKSIRNFYDNFKKLI